MKKIITLLALFAILISGCLTQQPVTTTQSNNNSDYRVSYLFEYGGCRVYRFYDLGHTVYFTNCSGDTVGLTDSTEVRSSGFYNKPVNVSTYIRTKDSGYYKIQDKPFDVSSFKEKR